MLKLIANLFGLGPKVNYAEIIKEGAIILDVRSKSEFNAGHIKGSINIPVDTLGSNLSRLRGKDVPIITCCASGARSAAARNILTSKGFQKVYNGGGWNSLRAKIQ